MRALTALALLSLFGPGDAAATRPSRYDVLALHRLLVIGDTGLATSRERDLEQSGGVIVSGIVGDIAKLPDGSFHVWLRPWTDDELIARFAVPVSAAKGSAVELHCPAPKRSYALVIGDCQLKSPR